MNKILFSERLKSRRIECGYKTQYALAKEYNQRFSSSRKNRKKENTENSSGIWGTIKNYENVNYTGSPNLDIVDNLCKILQCDVDYLLGNIDCKTHNVQYIQNETGLSELAINMLQASNLYNNSLTHDPALPFINKLLEQLDPVHYNDILHAIAAYLRSDGLNQDIWYNIEDSALHNKEYNRGKDFNFPIPAHSEIFDSLLLINIQERLRTLKKQIKKEPDTD